jgi:hypothetical protein
MRTGRTYTRHFNVETRQHELLGIDLGEGAPRRALVLGVLLYLGWTGGLLLLFGFPTKVSFTGYVLPPLLVVVYGAQRSRRIDRRWNLACWALGVRYAVLGHRPIICGGRRAAGRSEWLSRRDRWSGRTSEVLAASPLGRLLGRTGPPGTGRAVALQATARLYGPDAVARSYGRRALKQQQRQGGTTS